ncbi:MAG TPA: hypothetical protein VK997_01645 [Deferrisomatales bacterium]|nr:hypothetical protein [Deferrisomatales bacterium]
MVEETSTSPWWDSSEAVAAAGAYARLERQLRGVIDRVGRRVCPGCGRLCCRGYYCRATAVNPWYAFVHRSAGGAELPADAAIRRDPFALGARGCELRAGRYVFCYSYNCPLIRSFVGERGVGDVFQEVSDLLLAANRLPGGRLLHERAATDVLTAADLRHILAEVEGAARRLEQLRPYLERALDPNAPARDPQVGSA